MAIKFIGVTYTDFTPEGKTEAIKGYRFNFIEDDMGYSRERGIGGESFTAWVSPDKLGPFGMNGPEDMPLLAPYIGASVEVHIGRGKGKVDGWNIRVHERPDFPPQGLDFPPEGISSSKKPNKLGA